MLGWVMKVPVMIERGLLVREICRVLFVRGAPHTHGVARRGGVWLKKRGEIGRGGESEAR